MLAIDNTQCAMFVPFCWLSSLVPVTFPGFLRASRRNEFVRWVVDIHSEFFLQMLHENITFSLRCVVFHLTFWCFDVSAWNQTSTEISIAISRLNMATYVDAVMSKAETTLGIDKALLRHQWSIVLNIILTPSCKLFNRDTKCGQLQCFSGARDSPVIDYGSNYQWIILASKKRCR